MRSERATAPQAASGRASPQQVQRAPVSQPGALHRAMAYGRPLDDSTRSHFEMRFGHDLSNVRIHTGAAASASARAVRALAYTVGRDVVFGDGAFAPDSAAGQQLLAHELAHVVQQAAGSNRGNAASQKRGPTGLAISAPDDAAEREANAIGSGALLAPSTSSPPLLQRAPDPSITLDPEPRRALNADAELTDAADEAEVPAAPTADERLAAANRAYYEQLWLRFRAATMMCSPEQCPDLWQEITGALPQSEDAAGGSHHDEEARLIISMIPFVNVLTAGEDLHEAEKGPSWLAVEAAIFDEGASEEAVLVLARSVADTDFEKLFASLAFGLNVAGAASIISVPALGAVSKAPLASPLPKRLPMSPSLTLWASLEFSEPSALALETGLAARRLPLVVEVESVAALPDEALAAAPATATRPAVVATEMSTPAEVDAAATREAEPRPPTRGAPVANGVVLRRDGFIVHGVHDAHGVYNRADVYRVAPRERLPMEGVIPMLRERFDGLLILRNQVALGPETRAYVTFYMTRDEYPVAVFTHPEPFLEAETVVHEIEHIFDFQAGHIRASGRINMDLADLERAGAAPIDAAIRESLAVAADPLQPWDIVNHYLLEIVNYLRDYVRYPYDDLSAQPSRMFTQTRSQQFLGETDPWGSVQRELQDLDRHLLNDERLPAAGTPEFDALVRQAQEHWAPTLRELLSTWRTREGDVCERTWRTQRTLRTPAAVAFLEAAGAFE